MSPGNPFILGQKVNDECHEAQKECQHGFLHSCECWLLLVNNNNNNNPICKAPECQKTSVALADRNSRAN